MDLATVSYTSSSVSVLLGNGNGTFAPAVNYATAYDGATTSVVAADFNHDGKIDLAVLAGATLSVLLGNGDGTFQNYSSYPSATGAASSLLAADFTGQGNVDLAVLGGTGNDNVYVLAGDGKGGFGAPASYYPGIGPAAFVAADFDQDGGMDLAVTNANSTVTVMLNEVVAALFPGALNFPHTVVGTNSKNRTVRFSNPGTVSAVLDSIKISGPNADDFAETNNCGASVLPGKSCTVTLDFQPTAKGKRSAVLIFTDNALHGTQTVPLGGTGR